jgi:hypothetical protein
VRELPSGLAVVEDFRRQPRQGTEGFAARRLDLTDDLARRRATAGSNAWQKEAWEYADEIEEVKFAANFRGALMRRLLLYAGFVTDPGQAPIPVEDAAEAGDLPTEIALAAAAELERLGSQDQQAELLGQWGGIATVSGESYLVGQENLLADTGETWRLFSESNMVRGTATGNATAIRTRPGGTPENLDPGDAVIRVWRPHPRWPDLADANMRAVLGTAEEILIYARQMRAVGKSRTSAPLLYVANEMGDPPNLDGKPTLWETNLITSLVAAITDDAAVSAAAPNLIRGPAAFGRGQNAVPAKDAIFTIDLSRKIDEKAIERISFLVKRLAHGLDVPVEIITGIADVNHWTAWQIEDSTYKSHIEPDALVFATALTTELLRPGLLDLFGPAAIPFIRRLTVAINPAALVVRPNRAKDALDAFDRWGISWAALRDHLNFGEDEAPDEDEMLLRLALRSPGAVQLTAPMLDETGLYPGAADDLIEVTGGSGDTSGAVDEAGQDQPTPDDDQPEPSDPAARAAAQVLAAARARLRSARTSRSAPGLVGRQLSPPHDRSSRFAERSAMAPALGERLGSIDRELMSRLLLSASDTLTEALRVIGNRLRTQAQGNPAAAQAVKGVPADQVAAVLLAAGLPVPDIEPLAADQFDGLGDRWAVWVPAAFAATAEAVVRATPDDDEATAERITTEVTAAQEARSTAGWSTLLAALVGLAVARTLDPTALTPEGESDALVRVPAGIVRNAIATTGGVGNPGGQPFGLASEIGPGQSVGGIATGPNTTRALRIAGYSVAAWEWHHGIPSNPLPAHSALAGTRFSDWGADVLLNTGAFPPFSHLFPGDHVGCTCSTTAVLAPITEG